MNYHERDIRKYLDRMFADNSGRPIEAYKGEGGEVITSRDERRMVREQAQRARRDRERKAKKSAFNTAVEALLALPDEKRAEVIKLMNARKG